MKITLLYFRREFFKEGMSYMMRGHELRSQAPHYLTNITARTQFFKAPALTVTEALMKKAEELLHPPVPATPLKMSVTFGGLMTVEGEVVEVNICGSIKINKYFFRFSKKPLLFYVFKSKNNNFCCCCCQTNTKL